MFPSKFQCYTLVVDHNGDVWGCGANGQLQLDLRDGSDLKEEFFKLRVPKLVTITAGYEQWIGLDENNRSWGTSSLMHGKPTSGFLAVKNLPCSIKWISAGFRHFMFIDDDGYVWGRGENVKGQLGMGDQVSRVQCRKLSHLVHIEQVVCGDAHTLFLDKDGRLFASGQNDVGQLGVGDRNKRISPCEPLDKSFGPILSIGAGYKFSIVLDYHHVLWSSGFNCQGRLGIGDDLIQVSHFSEITSLPPVHQFSVGFGHTLVLDVDEFVWAFGYNGEGQLGLGDEVDRYYPIKLPKFSLISKVAAGYLHSMFSDREGNVWMFGSNQTSELGFKNTRKLSIPTLQPAVQLSGIKIKQIKSASFIGKRKSPNEQTNQAKQQKVSEESVLVQ